MRNVLISSINTTVFFFRSGPCRQLSGKYAMGECHYSQESLNWNDWRKCLLLLQSKMSRMCWKSLLSVSSIITRCWWPWRLSLWIYGGESKGAPTPNFSCFFIWRCGVNGDEKLNAAAPPRRSTCPLPPVFFFFFPFSNSSYFALCCSTPTEYFSSAVSLFLPLV